MRLDDKVQQIVESDREFKVRWDTDKGYGVVTISKNNRCGMVASGRYYEVSDLMATVLHVDTKLSRMLRNA